MSAPVHNHLSLFSIEAISEEAAPPLKTDSDKQSKESNKKEEKEEKEEEEKKPELYSSLLERFGMSPTERTCEDRTGFSLVTHHHNYYHLSQRYYHSI